MYLYTSVFSAGMRNIVTQMFFDKYYQDDKETLVSIALFVSALFTTFGIIASSKVNNRDVSKGTKMGIVIGMTAAVSVSFAAMFLVRTFIMYTLLFGISSFCINYMYNVFDVFISANVSAEERERNVSVLLSYQMAGYIVGPLFFSFFAAKPWLCIAFTLAAQLVGYIYVGADYIRCTSQTRKQKVAEKAEKKYDTIDTDIKKSDSKAMSYCFFMYCATNMLMPSIAYLMKDYLNVQGYAVKSSLFLAAVVIVSSAVIVLASAKKMWRLSFASPLAMGAALLLILMLRSSNICILAAAALISGAGYGIFLSGSRFYANAAETERDLVHRYNKVMTESTLIGYIISAAASWLCVKADFSVVPVKIAIIMLMYVIAAFRTNNKNSQRIVA